MDKHLPNEKTIEDLYADTENTWDYEDDEEGEFSGEKFNYHFVIGNEKIVFNDILRPHGRCPPQARI